MSSEQTIESFAKKLSRALSALPSEDRADIVEEIKAHLHHRDSESRLDEAITALGSPQQCAQNFLTELRLQQAFTDGGPTKTFGALLTLASSRATAAVGLFITGVFFLVSVGFAAAGIAEIITPSSAGLWSDPDRGVFFLGVSDNNGADYEKELLGRWMIPVSAAASVIAFIIGQRLGRMFIKLMMK